MASKNKLLGSGKVDKVVDNVVAEVFERVWLYHKAVPAGLLITTQKQFDECIGAGWVNHPGKCTLLPGHEKLFGVVEEVEVPEEPKEPEEVEEKVEEPKAKVTKTTAKKEKAAVEKLFNG